MDSEELPEDVIQNESKVGSQLFSTIYNYFIEQTNSEIRMEDPRNQMIIYSEDFELKLSYHPRDDVCLLNYGEYTNPTSAYSVQLNGHELYKVSTNQNSMKIFIDHNSYIEFPK